MAFAYRLEKVLHYRINKKDEQIEVVKKAEQEVLRIQEEINKNKETIITLQQAMRTAHHTMMESYDAYIKHLYDIIEKLEEEKQEAIRKLEEEKEKLVEMEKAVKIMEKHKERKKQEYIEEQNKAEMKVLDEIASQKYFAKTKERKEEELAEEILKEYEGDEFNEY